MIDIDCVAVPRLNKASLKVFSIVALIDVITGMWLWWVFSLGLPRIEERHKKNKHEACNYKESHPSLHFRLKFLILLRVIVIILLGLRVHSSIHFCPSPSPTISHRLPIHLFLLSFKSFPLLFKVAIKVIIIVSIRILI